MTEQEARDRAETRVYVYMNSGDIDYYFDTYKLTVNTATGRKKAKPSRSEKESAIIDYLTAEMITKSTAQADKAQALYEERFKHDIGIL